jgi:hypothetical protein
MEPWRRAHEQSLARVASSVEVRAGMTDDRSPEFVASMVAAGGECLPKQQMLSNGATELNSKIANAGSPTPDGHGGAGTNVTSPNVAC